MSSHLFHEGEKFVQARANEREAAERHVKGFGTEISDSARPLIEQHYMVALGSMDAGGEVLSSMVFGPPGFISVKAKQTVVLEIPLYQRDVTDKFWSNIVEYPEIGMLFIDLATRKRYRINGRLSRLENDRLEISVRETFSNCPRYIQKRLFKSIDVHAASGEVDRGKFLTERLQTRVDKADTMFIATSHPTKGIDVSHKGGSKGFMKLTGSNRLSFADYPGNSIFSTLGNIKIYPKVGVCIPDFDTGLLLQMSGCAYLSFDQNDANVASGGSGRIIDIEIDQWILRRMPLRPEWDPPEASIYNPPEDA